MVIAIFPVNVQMILADEVTGSEDVEPASDEDLRLDGLQTDVYNTWTQAVEANQGIQEVKDSIAVQEGLITDYQEAQKKDVEGISNGISELQKDTDNILSVLNTSLNSETDSDNPPKTLDDVYNLLYVLINSIWMGLGLTTGMYIMRCAFV